MPGNNRPRTATVKVKIEVPVLTDALVDVFADEMRRFVGEPLTEETGLEIAAAIRLAFLRTLR